jgi:phage FluMu protein Com
MRYRCRNCNYLYELKEGKRVPKKCPYCSKDESLEKVKSAQELLDEVGDVMDERERR